LGFLLRENGRRKPVPYLEYVSGHLKTYFFDHLPGPILLGWTWG
jgi:hypothetical protein